MSAPRPAPKLPPLTPEELANATGLFKLLLQIDARVEKEKKERRKEA